MHQQGGFTCIEVFFFRTGQNWGNRAYFPRADRSISPGEILAAFLAQFYDDKPCPRLILISHDIEERELLAEALSTKSGRKIEIAVPQRGEKRDLIEHALANAREALGRKLAEASSQQRLLRQLAATFGLPRRRAASRSTTTATSRAQCGRRDDRRRARRLPQTDIVSSTFARPISRRATISA